MSLWGCLAVVLGCCIVGLLSDLLLVVCLVIWLIWYYLRLLWVGVDCFVDVCLIRLCGFVGWCLCRLGFVTLCFRFSFVCWAVGLGGLYWLFLLYFGFVICLSICVFACVVVCVDCCLWLAA